MNYINYILIIILVNLSLFGQNYSWKKIPKITNHNIHRVEYVDSLHLWAIGDSGLIIRSNDGGNNWIKLNTGVNTKIINFSAIDSLNCFAIIWRIVSPPFGTSILKTSNGGISWELINYPDDNIYFHAINFTSPTTGWLAGEQAIISKTENGGNEWKNSEVIQSPFSTLPILELSFFNSKTGIACGGHMDIAGVIWLTSDGGISWKASLVGPEPIQRIKYVDSIKIIGVGGDYEYGSSTVVSYDAGINWHYTSLNFFGIPTTLSFQSKFKYWSSLGMDPYFMVSSDSGFSWNMLPTPDSVNVLDIKFYDSTKAIAVGAHGNILIYKPDSTTGITKTKFQKKLNIEMSVFPNPVNPTSVIKLNINKSLGKNSANRFKIKIFNAIGKEVKEVFDGILESGENYFNFSCKDLSSGVYYCSLFEDNIFVLTNKILVIK